MESAGIALRSLFCGSPPPEAASEVSGWSRPSWFTLSLVPAMAETPPLTSINRTVPSLCPPSCQLWSCRVPFLLSSTTPFTSPLPITSTQLLSGLALTKLEKPESCDKRKLKRVRISLAVCSTSLPAAQEHWAGRAECLGWVNLPELEFHSPPSLLPRVTRTWKAR